MAASASKKRKASHSAPGEPDQSSTDAQKHFFKNASSWNLEQDYESRPRKGKKPEKPSTRLPIKTADGRIEALKTLDDDGDDISVESDTEWLEGNEDGLDSDNEMEEEPKAEEPEIPEDQQILEAQEEMAKIASSLNESPEENAGGLKILGEYSQSKIKTIQMLAMVTQMSVYKDIIPGYRIRPLTEAEQKETVSKDIRVLRQFEQSLVNNYQNYVKELSRCAKAELAPLPNGQTLSSIAYSCACTLLNSAPHFNYRTELIKILVWKLSKRRLDPEGIKCQEALHTMFREDDEGRPSMEAVSLLSKMMRVREYQIDQNVLNLFLSLRLLSEYGGKASTDRVDRYEEPTPKTKKSPREFRTKKTRKNLKEQKALDKDMAQADALVSHEERDRMQSETLKLVFATYFRILKQRESHLMGAVLEGLAKYARLINQDFFGDLLEALKDLIRYSDNDAEGDDEEEEEEEDDIDVRNLTREALLCTVTAYALLAGQDVHNSRNDLHLDLSFFTSHLYKSLLTLSVHADLENTRPVSSTSSRSKINVQTTTVLLLRALTAILLPPWNIRSVPPLRLAAFTKQLMTTSLQLPEKSCQGTLALLSDVANTHGRKIKSLWDTEERKGDGKFNPVSESIEGSNPFATTVWEGELLKKHFSPKVREGVQLLEKELAGRR